MDNRLLIAGIVARRPETRTSPAGIPITRFTLRHQSQRPEAGLNRRVECSLQVVVCGHELGRAIKGLQEGEAVRVAGFLSRADHRNSEATLALHAERIERLQPQVAVDEQMTGD
ncbi:MAG: primosomal replication protein N [Gammaproteobacteria bacterium HGW-Gammaproteobacteria-1]|nr:MAG: primosomal replication protein N [Gammaproteobacteria bacterium HGW-Gammaproteobacteria-1]